MPKVWTRWRQRRFTLAAVMAVAAALVLAIGALATHSEESLPGSNFEIDTDANLRLDDASPSIDWATVAEDRKQDTISGSGDESFGQGTKEDTAVPSVVDGSIPPNKSDLKFFGVHQEGTGGGGFLNLYWSRVQEPSGTTNMDFEFNKRQCTPGPPADADCTSNGLTPIRSSGDLLIQYDLSQGGVNPVLFLSRWIAVGDPGKTKDDCEASNSLPCWSEKNDLTAAGDATGSINTSVIPASESDGLGEHSARTFGEAQLDLTAIFDPNVCQSFGSAYLKSRSSDSFTAALKDFVPPAAVNIANCGSLAVNKYIDNDENGSFLAANDNQNLVSGDLTGWSFSVSRDAGGFSCTGTTNSSGVLTGCDLSTLAAGAYTVTENANASKTIGTNSSPFFNTDPGTTAAPPASKTPASKATTVTIGGNQTVRFGNTCFATASFELTGVPSGQSGLFVEYTITAGPDANFPATTKVDLVQQGATTTWTASVPGLRKGDSISWSFGINKGLANEQKQPVTDPIVLSGYPSCSGSGSAQFQTTTVTAFKYKDVNADGSRQAATEAGLGGFSFELRQGATVVATTKSTATGDISFANIAPGSYTIHEVNRPTGWQQTDPVSNGSLSVTATLGDPSEDAGVFGNTPLSTIDVEFNPLAKLPNVDGTPSSVDATKATAISCSKTVGGASVGGPTSTGDNDLTTGDLTLASPSITCVITFEDP